jgi:hypothetical protein
MNMNKTAMSCRLSLNEMIPGSIEMALRLMSNLSTKVPRFPTATTITRKMSSGIPSSTAQAQASSIQPTPTNESIGVRNTSVNTVPGVSLSPHQNLLVGSVLDVRPSP